MLSAAASPEWVGKTDYLLNGDVAQRRFNASLRHARDRMAFPILIVVAVPLTDGDRASFPIAAESSRFAELEAVITGLISGRGVLAGLAADSSAWLFFIYAGQTSWLADFEERFRAAASDHEVGIAVRDDKRWRAFGEHCPPVRSLRRDRIVTVCVVPLLGLPGFRYGAAWGLGGVAANLAWVVPVLGLGRWSGALAAKLRQRPGWAFVLFVYLSAMAFLGLAELFWTPRQPLAAVVAAAGLGVAVTSALWPAQRRYYGRMRAREALRVPARPVG